MMRQTGSPDNLELVSDMVTAVCEVVILAILDGTLNNGYPRICPLMLNGQETCGKKMQVFRTFLRNKKPRAVNGPGLMFRYDLKLTW